MKLFRCVLYSRYIVCAGLGDTCWMITRKLFPLIHNCHNNKGATITIFCKNRRRLINSTALVQVHGHMHIITRTCELDALYPARN